MTVKIIKEGTLPIDWLIGRCSNCGCVVEATRDDPNVGLIEDWFIECPTQGCNSHITLDIKE